MRVLSLFALALPLVSALQFTAPPANSTLTKGSSFDLTWDSVDTDPESFSAYIVNFVTWPPFYQLVAEDLETATGAATVKIPCDLDNSWGWQFNGINGTNVYIIYAQSDKFSIKGDDCTDPVTSATCPPATATVTVSKTLSSAAVVTKITTITSAYCPLTVGYGPSGYSYPVTLTSAPSPPGVTAAPPPPDQVEEYASTSTIYSTVYRDLSEGCGSC